MAVISRHTLERYREFYPEAEVKDAQVALAMGDEIPVEVVRGLLGRRTPTPGKFENRLETFVMHRDRTGIFVIGEGVHTVTFIRLSEPQQVYARRAMGE